MYNNNVIKHSPKLRNEPVQPNLYFSMNLKKRIDKNLGMEIPRDSKKIQEATKITYLWVAQKISHFRLQNKTFRARDAVSAH